MLNEAEVRSLVEEATEMARMTSPDNMINEAIVSRVMKDEYGHNGWRSKWFEELDLLRHGV